MLKHKDLLTLFAKFESVVVLRESSIEFCYSWNNVNSVGCVGNIQFRGCVIVLIVLITQTLNSDTSVSFHKKGT